MSFLRRLSGKRRTDKASSKPKAILCSIFRPKLEALEDRVVPAVDWAKVATGLAGAFGPGGLSNAAPDSNSAAAWISKSAGALPILGAPMSAQTTKAQQALTQIGNGLRDALRNQPATASESDIENALLATGLIRDVTGDFNPNGTPKVDAADIDVRFDAASDIYVITARLGNSVNVSGQKFDLGLPGVPFRLGDASLPTRLTVTLNVDYNRLTFGFRNNGFFTESPGGRSELQVGVAAALANAKAKGSIGFFQMEAEAVPGQEAVKLDAKLIFDANGLVLSAPRLGGSADVKLRLDAKLLNNVAGQATFPHMKADFVMHWDLAGAYNAATDSLGSAPTAKFENVEFGLGSFLGNMTRPIADTIKKITDPLKPVFNVLAAKIPGISDLTEAAGLGETSILKLAQLANGLGLLPPSYGILVDAVVNLNRVMSLIDKLNYSQNNDVMLPVGSFDLSGNGDLRRLTLNGGARTIQDWFSTGQKNLTELRPVATAVLESIEAKVRNGNLPDWAKGAIQEVFGVLEGVLRRLDNGFKVGMHFPLLENPESVYRLLLGQDVSFVTFDAKFNFDARVTSPIPAFGILKAGFFGRVNLKAEIHAGVDTFGLRQFVESVARGAPDPLLLKNGFYVRTDVPLLSLDGVIGVEAGVAIGIGVLYIEPRLSGQIGTGQVPFTVRFADRNGDGVLRPLMAGELDGRLFHVDASLAVGFNFDIDLVLDVLIDDIRTNVVHIPIAYRELLNTTSINASDPFTGVGQPPPKLDIVWDTNYEEGSDDGQMDIVKAKVNGNKLELWFNNVLRPANVFDLDQVKSLKIVGSDDDSSVEVFGGKPQGDGYPYVVEPIRFPISVDGGGGNDQLDFNDRDWAIGPTARYKVTGTEVGRGTRRALLGPPILETRIEHQGMEVIQLISSDFTNTAIDIDYVYVPVLVSAGNVDNTIHLARISRNLNNVFSEEIYLDIPDDNNHADSLFLYDTGVRPTFDNQGRQTSRLNYHLGSGGLRRFNETVLVSPNLPGGSTSYTDFEQWIPYWGFESVTLNAANTGNSIVVDTGDICNFVISTGAGDDDVRVNNSYWPLTINGEAGRDVVTIGTPEAGMSGINSRVSITNKAGYTTLNIDDAADPYGRFVNMSVANGKGSITGFMPTSDYLPTDVVYNEREIRDINIRTGSGGDVFTVDGTANNLVLAPGYFDFEAFTTIDTGGGDDTIKVNKTDGPLVVNTQGGDDFVTLSTYPAGLTPMNGYVFLEGGEGDDHVTVNARNLVLDSGSFTTPEGIHGGSYSGFETFFARVPSGNSTVTVRGLAETVHATILGASRVTLGAGRLADIKGTVSVRTDDGRQIYLDGYRGSPTVSLTINDSLNPTPTTYAIGATSFAAVYPDGSPVFSAAFGQAAVRFLTFYGGSGGNTVTLTGTQPFANTLITRLHAGTGADTVNVETAGSNVIVYGQGGEDVVNLGKDGSVQGITGSVRIGNAGGFSTVNIDNSADATPRAVRLDRNGDYGTVRGLAPNLITYYGWETRAVNVRGGSGGNAFDVANTFPETSGSGARTTVYAGAGSDTINVIQTTSPLTVDPQGGNNLVTIGGRPGGSGELTSLVGDVTLRGESGVGRHDVDVIDRGFPANFTYDMDDRRLQRISQNVLGTRTSTVHYADFPFATLDLFAGDGPRFFGTGGHYFAISGTPTATDGVTVTSGTGVDSVELLGTNGDLTLNLGAGAGQSVSVGDGANPLERLNGTITVTAASPVVASFNNQATTEEQQNVIDRYGPAGASVLRYEYRDLQYFRESEVLFNTISQLDFHGGRGKYQPTFVLGTPAGMTANVYGAAGWGDTFWVSPGENSLLGPVNIYAQGVADNDFTYYYDYQNKTPHTYTLFTDPAAPTAQRMERDGAAPFTFHGGYQIIFYAGHAGGNTINVQSVPETIYLNMVAGIGDRVTFGSQAPGLGGTLAGIRGGIAIQGFGGTEVVFDDSGNTDTTPKRVTFTREASGSVTTFNYIQGLTGAGVAWNMYGDASISILGGAADETYAFASNSWPADIRIDGGGGTNTLDYSSSVGLEGQVNRFTGVGDTFSGYIQEAVSGQVGALRNGAGFAAGKVGQAFALDGTDDFVEVSDYPTQTPDSITLDAWVNPDTVTGDRVIVSKYDSSQAATNLSWVLMNRNGRLRFGVYQGTTGRVIDTDAAVLAAGTWQHVAATFDVATQAVTIYVNGVAVPTSFVPGHEATITAINDSTSPVRIGSYVGVSGTVGGFWDGLVDEVGVFDRALSAAEVRSIFEADSGGMSAVAAGVAVNLRSGTATGLRGGIANIRNVVGSAGNDILVGNGGNVLTGGAGRDLLIAGPSASTLFGGDGEDLLIGGTTAHDANPAALDAVMAELSRMDADLYARLAVLRGGLLAGTQVRANGGQNGLYGGDAADVLFGVVDVNLIDDDERDVFVRL